MLVFAKYMTESKAENTPKNRRLGYDRIRVAEQQAANL
jgi:hypothetical protein